MSRHPFQTPLSILLFRTILLTAVRAYWHPKIRGAMEALDSGPAFLYGNHSNRWDPFILNCFTPWLDPTGGVMTQEFFRRPFLSWALRRVDIHPTRKRITEPHLIRILHRMIDEGRKIVIYPEGGARWAGRPEPWIESTTKVFVRMGIPVYPVLTHGSYASWPRWATYPRPASVDVQILKPLRFLRDHPLDEAARLLSAPIGIDENMVADSVRPRWAYRPADGIHRLIYRDPATGEPGAVFTRDGTYVENADGSLRLKMLPDSRLLDEKTGRIHLTGDLYEHLYQIPFEPRRDGSLLTNNVDIYTEESFPQLMHHGPADASLFSDHIQLRGSVSRSVSLADVRGVDIERNFKLQLFLDRQMLQMSFVREGSALAWRDALRQLSVASGNPK